MRLIETLLRYVDVEDLKNELETSPKLVELIESYVENPSTKEKVALFNERSKESKKQLVLRLEQHLLSYVFKRGISFKNKDRFSREYQDCLQRSAIVRLLSEAGNKPAAMELGEKTILKARRMEYTDLVILLARDLYFYYASSTTDSRKSKKYLQILRKALEMQRREVLAELYYGDLRNLFKQLDANKRSKGLKVAAEYCIELEPYIEDDKMSYRFLINAYRVLCMKSELEQDFIGLLNISNRAIQIFSTRKITRPVALYLFNLRKVVAYMELDRYGEAEKIAEAYLPQMSKENVNYFVLNIYLFLCYIHTRKYKSASTLLQDVIDATGFKKQNRRICEIWTVYGAYLELLRDTGFLDKNEKSNFRIGKFLNELPIFSKDKRGLNIAILIIQFLFLLHKRRYSELIDRTDALKQYCYRYLRKDDTFRSHCFIRMLLQIPRADFNRIRTERYAEPYVKKLKSVPLRVSEQSIEVEIIPYDDLWEMTLELLN